MASACRCASVGSSAPAGAPDDSAAASLSPPAGASAASFSGLAGASAASLSPPASAAAASFSELAGASAASFSAPAGASAASSSLPPSDAGARRAWSHAASSARRSTAPTSGVKRPRTTTIPSSSTHVRSSRLACCRRSSACSTFRSMRRHARAIRSTCAAVPASATSSRDLLVLRRGHPRDRAHLRVRDLAAAHGVAQLRQLAEGARHAHVLAGSPQREPGPPAQPLGAREATVPAVPLVELADEHEQLVGGGLDAGRQLGDAIAEPREPREPRAAVAGSRCAVGGRRLVGPALAASFGSRGTLAGSRRRLMGRRLVGGLGTSPALAAAFGSRGTLAGSRRRLMGRRLVGGLGTSPALGSAAFGSRSATLGVVERRRLVGGLGTSPALAAAFGSRATLAGSRRGVGGRRLVGEPDGSRRIRAGCRRSGAVFSGHEPL